MQPMRKCGCKMCRLGLHRPGGSYIARRAVRRFRREARVALRQGREPEPTFSVPYTD